MKPKNTKRRIVDTVVGAAVGAAIAGPAGAIVGGIVGNKAGSLVKDLGKSKTPRKRSKPAAKGPSLRTDLKRILVPVDFSEHSLAAVRYARDWAARFRAEVCLLHVREPMDMLAPFGAGTMAVPQPPPDFRSKLKADLDAVARKEFPRNAKVSVQLREGVPYDEIVGVAKKLKADIIIITTHGRTGLMRMLLGSTAERVVRHATCPVLTVRSA